MRDRAVLGRSPHLHVQAVQADVHAVLPLEQQHHLARTTGKISLCQNTDCVPSPNLCVALSFACNYSYLLILVYLSSTKNISLVIFAHLFVVG